MRAVVLAAWQTGRWFGPAAAARAAHLIDDEHTLATDERAEGAGGLVEPLLAQHLAVCSLRGVVVQLERNGQDGLLDLGAEHARGDEATAADGHKDVGCKGLDCRHGETDRLGYLRVREVALAIARQRALALRVRVLFRACRQDDAR